MPLHQRKPVMLRLNWPHSVDTMQEIQDFLHPGILPFFGSTAPDNVVKSKKMYVNKQTSKWK